ncbi:hypothetical protein Tco_0128303 [Tanacetum coccineum]
MRDIRNKESLLWAIGSEEDERAIKKMNEQAIDKEKEQKAESVHKEVKEEEGAKKRKLSTRKKLKAKRRKHVSGSNIVEMMTLKMCLHIALRRVMVIRDLQHLMGVPLDLGREDLKDSYEL